MRVWATRTIVVGLASIIVACNFPKAQDPEDVAAEEQASAPASQPSVQSTSLPPECQTTGTDVVALALEAGGQGLQGQSGPGQVERRLDERCHRALEARKLDLVARGQELEARRLQLEAERQRATQDQRLLDQLQALCSDGNKGACDAFSFATAKRGCCAWHHGARMCSGGKVVCFDGAESPTCSC
jgi:hypothetical protein